MNTYVLAHEEGKIDVSVRLLTLSLPLLLLVIEPPANPTRLVVLTLVVCRHAEKPTLAVAPPACAFITAMVICCLSSPSPSSFPTHSLTHSLLSPSPPPLNRSFFFPSLHSYSLSLSPSLPLSLSPSLSLCLSSVFTFRGLCRGLERAVLDGMCGSQRRLIRRPAIAGTG